MQLYRNTFAPIRNYIT